MATKTYNGRKFTTGDTIYFAKFGTRIDSGYASNSGKYGTCHAVISSLYDGSYAFPIYITGKVTTPSSGTFTGCTVKPSDCSKGYQVKVTYNHNGGSGTASQTGYVGKSLTGTSSRSGYTFAGWYTAASGGSKVTTIPKDAKTYYAHWTANKYTVTLNNQSATTAGTASVSATYGSAMPAITKPTKTGYTFGGYYTGTNGSGTQYYAASGASTRSYSTAGTMTLYAKWIPNTYTVVFNGNGATSGSMSNQSFTYNNAQALSANGFSRGAAYRFTGWNTSPDGNGTAVAANYSASKLTATNGGTVTLYAQWELQYLAPTISNVTALRYSTDPNDGEGPDDEGTQAHIEFDWAVDTLVDSGNYATSVMIQIREQGASTWTTLQNQTYSGQTAASISGTVTYTSNSDTVDTDKTYDVLISITDYYGTSLSITAPQATANTFISLAYFTMDFADGGKGMGIGKPAPTNGLRIGMDTEFLGSVEATIEYDSTEDEYVNGINDEALLTTATINKWKTILGIS